MNWRQLCELLEGARITFSIHCRSGLIGQRCQCWRCRADRGEPVTYASQAQAAVDAKEADAEWREHMRQACEVALGRRKEQGNG